MKMRVVSAVLALSLGLLLVGCGHTESHVAMFRNAENPPARVDLYVAEQKVERPYYEIALVQAIAWGDDKDVEHLAQELRDKAQSLGCDGVVRVQSDVGYTRAHAAGVCVRFLPQHETGGPP